MPPVIYFTQHITKTRLYNFDPLKPHFYIVKLGFTGVYIIFLISAQNIDCGFSLELPRRGGSNEYPQSMFWAEIWKNIRIFYLEIFPFLVVKFSIYLNRCVFVMISGYLLLWNPAYWLTFTYVLNKPKVYSQLFYFIILWKNNKNYIVIIICTCIKFLIILNKKRSSQFKVGFEIMIIFAHTCVCVGGGCITKTNWPLPSHIC